MSAYCTVTEVGTLGIKPEAYADKEPDDIQAQIETTSGEIDSYIGLDGHGGGRYTLPLIAPFPDVLKKCCAALAACDLVDIGGRDPDADSLIDVTRKRWLDWLKMIKGGATIPGVIDSTPGGTTSPSDVPGGRVVSAESRGYSVRGTGVARGPFQSD